MKATTKLTNDVCKTDHHEQDAGNALATGGLRLRTDLRAGLSWDNLDDQAQQLWSNLTNALSSLTGGTDTSSS
ncbi:MAG: hypothetical protein R2932_29255 [Caldilineaceae bacterium]